MVLGGAAAWQAGVFCCKDFKGNRIVEAEMIGRKEEEVENSKGNAIGVVNTNIPLGIVGVDKHQVKGIVKRNSKLKGKLGR